MSYYQKLINELLGEIKRPEVSARLVEGWMRCEHSTLDHLSRPAFKKEVEIAVQCIDSASPEDSETLARSYGL